jgi:Protein of unknown function (DUF3987)
MWMPNSNSAQGKSKPTASVTTVTTVGGVKSEKDKFSCDGAFPLEVLPPRMAKLIEEVAASTQTPHALPGSCALATLSAVLGRGLVILNRHGVTRGNIFVVVGAPSGSGKSLCFKEIVQPVFKAQIQLRNRKASERTWLKAGQLIWDRKIRLMTAEGAKAGDADQIRVLTEELAKLVGQRESLDTQQTEPTLVCEDVTSEKLAVLLGENGETMFSTSPDAGQTLNVLLGRYNKLGRTDDTIYLKGYFGDFCQVDRTSRGRVSLVSPCLTLLWLVQPDKLDRMISEKSLTEGGFLPRALFCQVDTEPSPDNAATSGIDPETQNSWSDLLLQLFASYHQSSGEPQKLVVADEVMHVLTEHHNVVVDRRLTELADADSYAARWNEWAWRLTVVLHAAKHGPDAHVERVEVDTARGAIRVANWFADQQLGLLAQSRAVANSLKEKAVYELLVKKSKITARDVQQARIVLRAVESKALLARMERDGKLVGQDHQPKHGGHTVRYYWRP